MRDYGRVYSNFWQSPETRALTEDGRTLALYLLTSPHANLIGCFRLPDAYAADDLQWASERVSEGFRELVLAGFVARDSSTQWVLIHKYLKWNSFENANVAKAAVKAYELVPSGRVKWLLAQALLGHGQHLSDDFRTVCEAEEEPPENPLRTLPKPFANPEPEPEPIQSQNQNQNPARTSCEDPAIAEPSPRALVLAPPKPAKQSKPKTAPVSSAAWDAYSQAYLLRYGAEPVRNAKVNGQLANLVARLGDEAPDVARFFVGHSSAFYVRGMHAVDALLKDAEKLRTEWATNRQMTHTQAVATDRTQTNLNSFGSLIADAEAREAMERGA